MSARTVHGIELDAFALAYVACALWSSNDESTPAGGEPFDSNYDVADIAPETLRAMVDDCARFRAENAALLSRACDSVGYDWARAGHDFWLTRNGHGAGFWDRDELPPEVGDGLTAACKRFGGVDLYLGDDGRIYA